MLILKGVAKSIAIKMVQIVNQEKLEKKLTYISVTEEKIKIAITKVLSNI